MRVGQAQAYPVAGLHADVLEAARRAFHQCTELGIGPAATEEIDRDPIAIDAHRAIQQIRQQPRGKGGGMAARAIPRRHRLLTRSENRRAHQKVTLPPSESTTA